MLQIQTNSTLAGEYNMHSDIGQCIHGKTKRIFKDPDTISRYLYCSICHDVFENPMRVICGHTYCYACIESWGAYSKKCPMCNQNMAKRKLEKDLIPAQIIDELQVRCSHQNCEWDGLHSVLKKHQRICKFKRKNSKTPSSCQAIEILDQSENNQSDIIIQSQTSFKEGK